MKKELVFIVGAYNHKSNGNLEEYCKLELFCATEKEAIVRAKGIIKKKYYEVIQVIETKK